MEQRRQRSESFDDLLRSYGYYTSDDFPKHSFTNGIAAQQTNREGREIEDIDEYDYPNLEETSIEREIPKPIFSNKPVQSNKYKTCRSLRDVKKLLRDYKSVNLNGEEDPQATYNLLNNLLAMNNDCCNPAKHHPNPTPMKEKHCRQLQKTINGVKESFLDHPCRKDAIINLYETKIDGYYVNERGEQKPNYVVDIPATLEEFKRRKKACCNKWFYNKNPICKELKQHTKRLKAELKEQTRKQKGSRRWWWFGGKKTRRLKR